MYQLEEYFHKMLEYGKKFCLDKDLIFKVWLMYRRPNINGFSCESSRYCYWMVLNWKFNLQTLEIDCRILRVMHLDVVFDHKIPILHVNNKDVLKIEFLLCIIGIIFLPDHAEFVLIRLLVMLSIGEKSAISVE